MKTINKAAFEEEYEGDFEIVRALMGKIEEDLSMKLKDLSTAIHENEFGTVKELSHYIKGSVQPFYTTNLERFASELELSGKNQNLENASQILEDFHSEYQHFLTELRGLLES